MKRRVRQRQTASRREEWILVHVAKPREAIIPDGKKEIAELLGVAVEDLTDLPFGVKSTMWMSRSKQLDDVDLNVAATYALKLNGLKLAIRGPVVVHHEAR